MSTDELPYAGSWPVIIRRDNARLNGALVVASHNDSCSWNEVAAGILGKSEMAYFSTLRFARRQKSYLLGRYAAKIALSGVLLESDLRAIQIDRGVFEQPIVRYHRNRNWDVTISHTKSLAAALAYPSEHPMGIDVELIDPKQYGTILSQLSLEEAEWVESALVEKFRTATGIWTAKEALSKVLRTGLMSPVQIYKLMSFHAIDSGIQEGSFTNFAQYKAKVWTGCKSVLSIVFPKRSILELEEERLLSMLSTGLNSSGLVSRGDSAGSESCWTPLD